MIVTGMRIYRVNQSGADWASGDSAEQKSRFTSSRQRRRLVVQPASDPIALVVASSLDITIETMRQTGNDMSDRYEETSTGGLGVNVVEC